MRARGSSRRQAARPARSGRRQAGSLQARRFSWSRRIGAAAALLLLVGVGITFAGGALNNGARQPTVRPSAELRTELPTPTRTADTKAPVIHISRPEQGAVVYEATATLRGRTEAGATLSISDQQTGESVTAAVEDDGAFSAELVLQLGENTFSLSSEDVDGNRASTRLVITRATSLGSVVLSVSASDVELADLPTSLNLVAAVRDENGVPSAGAEAIFSVSPPNGSTQTYETSTQDGRAEWADMVVSGDRRAVGRWIVTVRVTLASGEQLRDDASFTVR